jgi:hypothetical protein
MTRFLSNLTYAAGAIGIFLGFYFLQGDPPREKLALTMVVLAFNVVMGTFSWIRHFLLWESDAKALGVQSAEPVFQWEVGFFNGALAIVGLLAVVLDWGVQALAVAALTYAAYLLQASALHGYRYITGQSRSPRRLWGSFIGLGVFCLMVIYISFAAVASV